MSFDLIVLKNSLKLYGFDLCHIFPISAIPNSILWFLNNNKKKPIYNTGIIIGNSKYLWPIFIQNYKISDFLKNVPDPLDMYSKQSINSSLNCVGLKNQSMRYFVHEKLSCGNFIPIQKLSNYSNQTLFDDKTHLSIHPIYGPWIGFRCAVFFNNPDTVETPLALNFKTEYIPEITTHLNNLQKGVDVAEKTLAFINVRQSIINGQDYRYSQDQINYHYFKDKSILNKL